jgi:hypothetical protein
VPERARRRGVQTKKQKRGEVAAIQPPTHRRRGGGGRRKRLKNQEEDWCPRESLCARAAQVGHVKSSYSLLRIAKGRVIVQVERVPSRSQSGRGRARARSHSRRTFGHHHGRTVHARATLCSKQHSLQTTSVYALIRLRQQVFNPSAETQPCWIQARCAPLHSAAAARSGILLISRPIPGLF